MVLYKLCAQHARCPLCPIGGWFPAKQGKWFPIYSIAGWGPEALNRVKSHAFMSEKNLAIFQLILRAQLTVECSLFCGRPHICYFQVLLQLSPYTSSSHRKEHCCPLPLHHESSCSCTYVHKYQCMLLIQQVQSADVQDTEFSTSRALHLQSECGEATRTKFTQHSLLL